jgi:hypothetical protein
MPFKPSTHSPTTELTAEANSTISKFCGPPRKQSRSILLSLTASTIALLAAMPVMAQETTGVPGSPSATTTIDGRYIPPPPLPFAGKADLSAADSNLTVDESFDVGADTRLSVEDNDYQPPFRFTGKLDKLTIKLGPSQLTAGDQK